MSLSNRFAGIFKRLLPSPFTIAILLTLFTFIIALVFTKPETTGVIEYTANLARGWERGLWNEGSGGLYFAFQMMFMLVLGHILALSQPFSYFVERLIIPCTTTANAALIVTFTTILVSLFNWGLGLIFGAILARKVGEKFAHNNKPLNYGLIGAAAYSGLMVWHGGLSGSAPLKAAEKGNLNELVSNIDGVDLTQIPDAIDPSLTLFSAMNITVTLALLILLPLLFYAMGKLSKPRALVFQENQKKSEINEEEEGMEKLDVSRIFSFFVGSLILVFACYKALILPDQLSLSFLTPNFINLSLLGLCLIAHKNIKEVLMAGDKAIVGAFGILLQFPFYFAIMGIMVGSGLIGLISEAMSSAATSFSFPIYTFLSAGLVNIFVPSGGGQWAVQGPIIIAAAQSLNVSLPKAIMALAYGDQLTNMLQPFWALPLLGITGLKAKEILPYSLVVFLAGLLIFLVALFLF